MNLAYLMFGKSIPEKALEYSLNEFSMKREGNKLRRKYEMQLSSLTRPTYKNWHPDEGAEDETSMQEPDTTLGITEQSI